MRKTIYMMAAVAAILGMAACSGNCGSNSGCARGDREEVYTGVLPAADCEGIRYVLRLDFDDDNNWQDGDYDLLETYVGVDTVATASIKDVNSYDSEGDFTVINGEGANAGKKYLKLVKNARKSSQGASDELYFEVDNDSTITLVNSNLERAATPLNYSLKLVRR